MRRYSCVFTHIWRDKKFRTLDDSAQKLFLELMTSPISNMIGFYNYPIGYAMADLNWSEDKFRENMTRLAELDMAYYDYDAQMVFICKFMKYNALDGIKQIAGAFGSLNECQPSSLYMKFAEAWNEYVRKPYTASMPARLASCNTDAKREGCESAFAEMNRISDEVQRLASTMQTNVNKSDADTLSIPYIDGKIDTEYPIDTLSIPYRYPIDIQEQEQEPKQEQEQEQEPKQKQKQNQLITKTSSSTGAVDPAAKTSLPNPEEEGAPGIGEAEMEPEAKFPDEWGIVPDDILEAWRGIAVYAGFPDARSITSSRKSKLAARIRESFERRDVGWWREYFGKAAASPFLVSEAKARKPWVSFDWFLNPQNMTKVLEGKYEQSEEDKIAAYYDSLKLSPTSQFRRGTPKETEYAKRRHALLMSARSKGFWGDIENEYDLKAFRNTLTDDEYTEALALKAMGEEIAQGVGLFGT